MDDIHEYLLLKGVDAVSIHGGKEQEERNEAIKLFKVRCARRRTIPRSTGLARHVRPLRPGPLQRYATTLKETGI